jgi:NAD(P)-dependent dehydrogenase (short-subunit alcohol dehydrogenase family)
LASVRKFADAFLNRNEALDLLVNNAGIMAIPKRLETEDGFEMQFATNHLGHFALTGLLLPALTEKPGSRVVTVASNAHRRGEIYFDDLQLKHAYTPWKAYSQSKLANVLFAFELQRKSDQAGWQLMSLAAHPGWSSTGIHDSGPAMAGANLGGFLLKTISGIFSMPAEQGALPYLYAGTASDVTPGGYYGPDGFSEITGYPGKAVPSAKALDKSTAAKLWELSEQLTGVQYKAPVHKNT